MRLWFEGTPELLFTDNETNTERLWSHEPRNGGFYKDAFHEYVIHGREHAVNPSEAGHQSLRLVPA